MRKLERECASSVGGKARFGEAGWFFEAWLQYPSNQCLGEFAESSAGSITTWKMSLLNKSCHE